MGGDGHSAHQHCYEGHLGIVEDQKGGWVDAVCLLHWKGTSPAPVAGFLGVDSPAFGARAVDYSGLGFPLTGNACQTRCLSRSNALWSAQTGVWFTA